MKKHMVSRRRFLKKTAGIAAGAISFPYIIPSSALGKAGTVAPSNRLTMAQIGCGSMGGNDMKAFLGLGNEVQVIAVCDVDDAHAQAKKKDVDRRYGNQDCKVYHDYQVLLENETLDCVSHALPDHWHASIAIACARKGIDMYGQKPFARSIREGRAMCEAIERYGLIWQTGSWQRSVEHFHRGAELVRNGKIGKIEHVEVGLPDGTKRGPDAKLLPVPDSLNYDLWLGSAPWRPYQDFGRGSVHWDWRWIMDYSGGQLTDWAGHHVDIAHWGLGLEHTGPIHIEGKGQYPTEGIYNTPYAYDFTCTYADGNIIRVANASALPHEMGVCWYGERGWIHVNRGGIRASNPDILRETLTAGDIRLYKSRHHQQNFVDCVKSRKETITPAETAHRSISVALLGEIAMQTGRPIKWNPETEQIIGDPQASRDLMRSYRAPWHL